MTFASIHLIADVRHRVRRRQVSRLHQQSRLRVLRGDFAGNGTAHDQGGIDLARGDHLIDFGIRLAEDADGIARGFESAFRGLFVGGRLFLLALGNSVPDPGRAPVPCWSGRKSPPRRSVLTPPG